ncbi:hypothetical protein Patl1_09130 [Pistacia atlantica]|uniref:Uncharacterized protein n=1 Tax=Pistacia atlantica TaxID=434234 RepID=A0ACC1ALE6_9ROSI|nr:hypothetical protein Patl1_09130 [Pistacia atlantica]
MDSLVSNRVDRGLCCFLKRSLDLDEGWTDFMSALPVCIRSDLLKLPYETGSRSLWCCRS